MCPRRPARCCGSRRTGPPRSPGSEGSRGWSRTQRTAPLLPTAGCSQPAQGGEEKKWYEGNYGFVLYIVSKFLWLLKVIVSCLFKQREVNHPRWTSLVSTVDEEFSPCSTTASLHLLTYIEQLVQFSFGSKRTGVRPGWNSNNKAPLLRLKLPSHVSHFLCWIATIM